MRIFTRYSLVQLFMLVAIFTLPAPATAINNPPNEALSVTADPVPVQSGKKFWIDRDHYAICSLDKAAKIGNNVFMLEIFDKNNQQLVDYIVKGHSDMPSMRGAHDSGIKAFVLSNKGKYLLPVAVVMPGDWAVKFTINKNNMIVFNGIFFFNV